MNILILGNNDGGLYQFRRELIQEIINSHNVFCCVPDEDGFIPKLEELGCKCVIYNFNRRGMNPIEDLSIIKKYKDVIIQTKADIVLTYTIKPNIYGGIACQRLKTPYISNITGLGTAIENGGVLGKIALTMYRIGLKTANCVFFQNKYNMELFKEKKIVSTVVRLIPGSGVNTKQHCMESYPKDDGLFRFLFVGRVMKDKGIQELLLALEMLQQDGNSVFLDVVGGMDEDYSSTLTEYEEKGLIKYHGSQNDVHSFYKQSQCVVLPSYHEGMANVMLEAAATGRPVITSNIPGCQETFTEGETGYGCTPKDTVSLKRAMERMIHTPWDKRKKMGIKGREKVENEFDRQIIIHEYIRQIDEIDSKKKVKQ